MVYKPVCITALLGEAGSQTPCVCLHLLPVPVPSHLHNKALLEAWSFIAMPEATFGPAQPHPEPWQQTCAQQAQARKLWQSLYLCCTTQTSAPVIQPQSP